MALESEADILIYGGQAGGGKTWLLVGELTRRIDNPDFRAVIFRRTSPQIMGGGGIWDEANKLYRPLGARMREGQSLDATFPSGAVVEFCHLQLEKNKFDHQGKQYAAICFDEVTHFTETQFFYLVSRNRSSSGIKPYIRATCNPDAGSWVAAFIDWWIDPESGLPIPERSGVLRYFYREENDGDDQIFWADSKEEIIALKPHLSPDDIMSVTFVPASLDDNQILLQNDPSYKSKLLSLPRVERMRLLGGNWKIQEGAIIDAEWIKRYTIVDNRAFRFSHTGLSFDVPIAACKRIATIDTAGSSKEKAAVKRGDPPSWSVCAVWDSLPYYQANYDGSRVLLIELLFLRFVWRKQCEWNELKTAVPNVLQTWNVSRAYIENAQTGPALKSEIKGIQVEMVGPTISGMRDSSNGAKYERAVASGMLTRVEQGKIFVPYESEPWLPPWIRELTVWTGLPKEVADQIDVTSYACHVSKKESTSWGGVIKVPQQGQRV
jgi:hypothetical protein